MRSERVRCEDCGSQAVESTHKGGAVQRCPDCGDILVRAMTTDDPTMGEASDD